MWLAYKIFEIAQMADGQESSTRYITMDGGEFSDRGRNWHSRRSGAALVGADGEAFAAYHAEYARLDGLAIGAARHSCVCRKTRSRRS